MNVELQIFLAPKVNIMGVIGKILWWILLHCRQVDTDLTMGMLLGCMNLEAIGRGKNCC